MERKTKPYLAYSVLHADLLVIDEAFARRGEVFVERCEMIFQRLKILIHAVAQFDFSISRHRRLSRLSQRHRVGTRWKSELPGRIVRGTPYHLGHVGLGRHCTRLRKGCEDALRVRRVRLGP